MAETISSRTPEGEPNVCPVCDGVISIDPSSSTGDAPCPRCGTLLWFIGTRAAFRFYELESVERLKERLYKALSANWGIPIERVDDLMQLVDESRDSLDFVELIMALEGEFDIAISDEDAEEIRTVADLLEWLLQQGGDKPD